MIEMTWAEPERVCRFVASQPGFDVDLEFGECKALGVLIDGALVAGVVFQNWNPKAGTMEISAGATDPRWMARKSLQEIFGYVFDTAACQLCVLQVSERNERMRWIARRLGFTELLIPRMRGRDEALVVYTLTDEQWAVSRIRSRRIGSEAEIPAAT